MPEIQLLDQATIEKIAAGEIVDRPSSVIKELVENAIDAKATLITVEIKEGGTSLMRITDNGCGIEREQVKLAFLRHSTSKIRSISDLMNVKSLGFRGEALASISAVAQVELVTRIRGALTGTRYVIEGSKEVLFEEIGAPEGTTFIVRNLFFNTPVRRKFLKTAQTEAGAVASVVERLALSHPEISFQLIVNNQQKLHTSGNGNQQDIIYHIYGRDIAANLLPVFCTDVPSGIQVSGFIGKPLISRGNRNFENYYVNGRYMKSNVIAKAIEDAYKPYLMNHQYPFTVLYLTMDEEALDVNVHPTKMEVRFAHGEQLYAALHTILRETLSGRELVPEVSAGHDAPRQKAARQSKAMQKEQFIQSRLEELRQQAQARKNKNPEKNQNQEKTEKHIEQIRESIALDSPYEPKYPKRQSHTAQAGQSQTQKLACGQQDKQLSLMDIAADTACEDNNYQKIEQENRAGQTGFLAQAKQSNVQIIGQLFGTYWLTQAEEKLYIIDQHAAHEKVLFERNLKRFSEHTYTSQQLSPPIILSLSMQEQQLLKEHLDELAKMGFELNEFGGHEYAIVAVPDNLYQLDAKAFFLELLDELTAGSSTPLTPELLLHKVASASCKAAIKGNQRISRAEIEALIQELLTLDNPYHCPHGRPTMIAMSKYEIEKKFKRVL